jgi:HPt (histidine-containing phosphotransfer) domain-containing protein
MAVLAVEAHSLKGTSATFGAEKLRAVSEKVEKAAKIGDESVVNENVPLIPDLLKEVLESLNKFSKGLGQ